MIDAAKPKSVGVSMFCGDLRAVESWLLGDDFGACGANACAVAEDHLGFAVGAE